MPKARQSATCHPDKPMKAHGLCKPCYMRKWKRENPEAYAMERRRYRARHPEIKRAEHRRRKYGLRKETFQAMMAAQHGLCAICGTAPRGGRAVLCVDHDHATGKVRALLCNHCNTGLGCFRDSREYMRRAISYLRQHAEGPHGVPAGTFFRILRKKLSGLATAL